MRSARWAGLALVAACGTDPATEATIATVEFVYAAPTSADQAVADAFPDCFQGVVATHIHPSWQDYQHTFLTADGADRWTVTFDDVPVGVEHRFRINDPNNCDLNSTGATTTNITANGVLLVRVVETPGSGVEPGLAFTVRGSGIVTP